MGLTPCLRTTDLLGFLPLRPTDSLSFTTPSTPRRVARHHVATDHCAAACQVAALVGAAAALLAAVAAAEERGCETRVQAQAPADGAAAPRPHRGVSVARGHCAAKDIRRPLGPPGAPLRHPARVSHSLVAPCLVPPVSRALRILRRRGMITKHGPMSFAARMSSASRDRSHPSRNLG